MGREAHPSREAVAPPALMGSQEARAPLERISPSMEVGAVAPAPREVEGAGVAEALRREPVPRRRPEVLVARALSRVGRLVIPARCVRVEVAGPRPMEGVRMPLEVAGEARVPPALR